MGKTKGTQLICRIELRPLLVALGELADGVVGKIDPLGQHGRERIAAGWLRLTLRSRGRGVEDSATATPPSVRNADAVFLQRDHVFIVSFPPWRLYAQSHFHFGELFEIFSEFRVGRT